MRSRLAGPNKALRAGAAALTTLLAIGCSQEPLRSSATPAATASAASPQSAAPAAPPASETGGFDGAKAYEHVAKLVAIGPRPAASAGIQRAQEYIRTQLQSYGCAIEEDAFHASTPIGEVPMKNIVAKAPGEGRGIILLLSHYDTLRKEGFVGAVDGGSSTGLLLEMARLMCKKKQPLAVWMAFLDGEEAFVDWFKDNDNTYGSRELAARLAVSGELKRVRAVILADMIGPKDLKIRRESNSTPWLTNLVWKTAARLGYQDVFVSQEVTIEDDHLPFLHRGIPAVDLIDFADIQDYWHTPEDRLDKVSPKSLAIVGHVILETVGELEQKTQ
jgi:glutaminyl-peptide cyclotransferase